MANYVTSRFRAALNSAPSDRTIRVSMLGPSGVGKTSLLATMYDQLENVIQKADLQVSPDTRDAATLNDQVLSLRRLFATDTLTFDPSEGIQGTSGSRIFNFGVGRRGRKATLSLQFVDYPGGWIDAHADEKDRMLVARYLRDSDAILIPVDAPALMERDGFWHQERNYPNLIYNFVQAALEDLQSPRLVILAPIRCERYLNDPTYEVDLAQKTIEGYSRLLDFVGYGALANWVSVVITPVQTLGEIVYHGSPRSKYVPYFVKTHPKAQYSPQDSEQPLRYLLRFAMRLHGDKRNSAYFAAIRRMFDSDEYLIDATRAFANGCKLESPFVVVQGHEWLEVGTR